MTYTSKTPGKSLSPALLKAKPSKAQFEEFKTKLTELVAQIKSSPSESEEHHKNHISDFLKYAFKFPAYFINTSERIDLAVHNGKSATDKVTLYAPNKFDDMTQSERIEACYQHAVLQYLSSQTVTNTTARNRFKLHDKKRTAVSNFLAEAAEQGRIKRKDPDATSSKFVEYVPYWA